ncbi:ASCH domain-containing protein [Geminisphaera colitermitum]|uniref:ASCH domain-containing protein n=1 Tax=Geminisphaera colitermitum TaxID=1148786 RepID=UPI00019655D1|nr:ASCH domain-containing protein [Geminisphaera colitermitum]
MHISPSPLPSPHPLDRLDTLRPSGVSTLSALFRQHPDLPRVALSIRQPWSFLIVHGFKDVENRTRRTNYRGPVLIHSGLNPYPIHIEDEEFIGSALGRPYPQDLSEEHAPLGGIVGVAEIVDCVTSHPSPWFDGPFGYVLRNARPLPFVPLKGKLGIFRVEAEK